MKLFALIGALCALVVTQQTVSVTSKSTAAYEQELTKLQFFLDNFDKPESYKAYEFVNKKTKETKKFSDFDDLRKHVFYLVQMDKFTAHLEKLQNKWTEELEAIDPTVNKSGIATQQDVKKFLNQLFELRKKTAVTYEKFLDRMFTKFPKDFTDKEKLYIMKSVKEYHDKMELIDR